MAKNCARQFLSVSEHTAQCGSSPMARAGLQAPLLRDDDLGSVTNKGRWGHVQVSPVIWLLGGTAPNLPFTVLPPTMSTPQQEEHVAAQVMGRVGVGAHFPHTHKHPTRLFMGNDRSRNGRPAGAGTMVTYFPLRFPSDPAQTWDPFLPLTPWFGGASVEAGGKTLHPSRSQTAAAGKGRRKRELWGRQSAQESPSSLAVCVMVGCQAHAGQTSG